MEEIEFLISMAVHVSFLLRARGNTLGNARSLGAGWSWVSSLGRCAGGGQGVSWGHVSSLLGHTVGSRWALLLAERLVVMSKTSPGAQ